MVIYKISDTVIYSSADTLPPKGCTTISLQGLSVGYAKITATHRYGNVIIQDTLHVAVYQPIKVCRISNSLFLIYSLLDK